MRKPRHREGACPRLHNFSEPLTSLGLWSFHLLCFRITKRICLFGSHLLRYNLLKVIPGAGIGEQEVGAPLEGTITHSVDQVRTWKSFVSFSVHMLSSRKLFRLPFSFHYLLNSFTASNSLSYYPALPRQQLSQPLPSPLCLLSSGTELCHHFTFCLRSLSGSPQL